MWRFQVWSRNTFKDDFLGQAIVAADSVDAGVVKLEVSLTDKGENIEASMPGKVFVELETYSDIAQL